MRMDIADANTLTHRIIGLAMRVHTRLGPGLLESAYEHCLCHELDRNGLAYSRQVDLPWRTMGPFSIAAIGQTLSSTTW